MTMNMRFLVVVCGSIAGVSGCYSFDSQADRFACTSDSDCSKGYVCNGHTLVNAEAVSYCVLPEQAKMGFAARLFSTPFTCAVIDEEGSRAVSVKAGTRPWRAGDDEPDPQSVTPTSFNCADGDDDVCCLFELNGTGGGGVLCLRPPDSSIEKLSLWVEYTNNAGETLMLLFDSQALPKSGPLLVEKVFAGGDWDRDISEVGDISNTASISERCAQRAAARIVHCSPEASNVCLCQEDAGSCPVGYFCAERAANRNCWPVGFGEEGTACNDDNSLACSSRNCNSTTHQCQ